MSAIRKVMKTVDPNCSKKILSIVVLSSNNVIIESISEALLDVHAMGNFRWKLVVLRSSSFEDIERTSDLTGAIYKDFVIVAVDTSKMFCLNWANTVLEQVQPHLRLRRVVFVNATNCPAHAMAVSASDLITFCSENRLELLNADVSKQEDAKFLARRLLKYLEVSIGVNTGIPNINI